MFDWLNKDGTNAIDLLKKDHDVVKELFDRFEEADDRRSKKKIATLALTELKAHAVLEEEIFYPAVRKHVGADIMNEADEEHHVAKVLVAELDDLDGKGDHWEAKFTVLSENIRHHIKEEEDDMLPKAKGLDIDFEALGQQMLRRKEQLLAKGFPPTGEEAMVAATHSAGDSPAKVAHKIRKPPARSKNGRTAAKTSRGR